MMKFKGYQPHLLVLTSNNLLQRVHLDTGEVLQSVYLSRKYKFKNLSWDEELETVVVKSTSFENEDGGQVSWLAFAVFQVYPFELIAMFEINVKMFGNDAIDLNISANKLISYHLYDGQQCYYSFPRILETFATKNIKLGDIYEDDVVGEYPIGIPCNVRITE
ncbi:DDB1- and CUL4-associated factor 17-like [Antedon mediterranea]|uniref:DDB1- and CUL4-associated factor 17-like n=1 Tax=Antedon mediterranea TaxID=105859 RepID=UPI003AF858AC